MSLDHRLFTYSKEMPIINYQNKGFSLRKWVQKLVVQLGVDWDQEQVIQKAQEINDGNASVLYILDTMSKYLIDIDGHPVRQTRQKIDDFSQMLAESGSENSDNVLFKIRQFYSSYRIDEFSYIQNTFDDFKTVIWDFADQLGEETRLMSETDSQIEQNLNSLREAVESNSIEDLRTRSREFIDFYIEAHTRRDERRTQRMNSIQKSLSSVEQKLEEATRSASTDHLTGAWNRRTFDNRIKKASERFNKSGVPASLLICDIDFFKRINDVFGHDIGDFVIVECVRVLKDVFSDERFSVCRIGGEEFAVIMPETSPREAIELGEEALERFRRDTLVHGEHRIQFTSSMGIASALPNEEPNQWMKRTDEALYESKNQGRDRLTVARHLSKKPQVA